MRIRRTGFLSCLQCWLRVAVGSVLLGCKPALYVEGTLRDLFRPLIKAKRCTYEVNISFEKEFEEWTD